MTQDTETPAGTVADAVPQNWVDSWAPVWSRPYLRLARADRPIGTWLLLWPCWWSLTLGAAADGGSFPDPWLMILFAIGAVVMRGAGCTYNDIVDRDFDAQVARTRSRPIPSGQVTPRAAAVFLVAQALIGLLVLLQLNGLSIGLGIASLALVAAYPFMKRITWWPQAWLGLTFNWGALMGFTAAAGFLGWPAVFLYLGGIAWTLGYDTIYAHQDREDDALIGVKSTALRFKETTPTWLAVFYGVAIGCFGAAGWAAGLGLAFYAGLAIGAGHLAGQMKALDMDDPAKCLAVFKSNRDFGAILFAGLVLGTLTAG